MSGVFVRGSMGERYTNPALRKLNEVDLSVLMSMVRDRLENPDRAWFLEVKLHAREWEKLVKAYYKGVEQK